MNLTTSQKADIERRFHAGEPLQSIAHEIGVPYSTVRDYVVKRGLKRPKTKSRSPWRTESFEQQRGPLLDRHQLRGGA